MADISKITLPNGSSYNFKDSAARSGLDSKADSSHTHSDYALKSKYGDTTINVGRKADTTVGDYSTAEGYNATASGNFSHAEGSNATASGISSHAEGSNLDVYSKEMSNITVTISDVDYTITGSTAYGINSHAEGTQSFAYGYSSHAEGYKTTTSGISSHAEGYKTTASGNFSHAEGYSTTASGGYSHTEGYDTTASGNHSHAGGTGTKALHSNEVAYGSYNESNDNTLFSIGDGTSDTARHNAFEITQTGGKLHNKDIAVDVSNPNLLINPDFKINQRGETDFRVYYSQGTPIPTSQKYTVDRWRIMDGEANISNGKFVLTGLIIQVLENSIGSDFTATVSVESGTATASYDDSTKTFSIDGNNAVLNWAKLEYGSVATPFISPDPATELLKCMRYYEILLPSGVDRAVTGFLETDKRAIFDMKFSVPKRCTPSLTNNSARIIVNTFDSYVSINDVCSVKQGIADKYGIVIASVDPVISSVPSDYIGVSMDTIHNAALAVDAEIY